jgi:RimJ/RimL family protein N-acetyltransferase
MDEIIGRSMKENKASIRVMQKLGMEFWKIDVCEGIEDTVYYRISKNQFIPSRAK